MTFLSAGLFSHRQKNKQKKRKEKKKEKKANNFGLFSGDYYTVMAVVLEHIVKTPRNG